MLHEATLQQGLEGIVSKRLDLALRVRRAQPALAEVRAPPPPSYVVGGWRPRSRLDDRLGALLVGEPTADGLLYRGRVGSGIAGKAGRSLTRAASPRIARDTSPFADEVPRVDALGTLWVEPVLVVDVETHGCRRTPRLRQPSYRGVRTDLTPEDLLSACCSRCCWPACSPRRCLAAAARRRGGPRDAAVPQPSRRRATQVRPRRRRRSASARAPRRWSPSTTPAATTPGSPSGG